MMYPNNKTWNKHDKKWQKIKISDLILEIINSLIKSPDGRDGRTTFCGKAG